MDHQAIKTLVEEFLKRLGTPFESVDIITDIGAHPVFFIRTTESHLLIGPKGEHLRSINILLRHMARKEGDEAPNFVVDVNGYHTKHIRDVQRSAELMAERVRMFHSSIEMSPMHAYDRMIIHSLFANDPNVATESEGEGKFRRVVLKYKTASPNS
jgi:spoIIIJ-associated protein